MTEPEARTVVIAGAGASAPLGYSTLVDFETAIAKYAPRATAKDRRELAELFRRVRQSLVSQSQYTDFEAILTQFARYLDVLKTLRVDQFLATEFLGTVPDRFRYSAFWQRVGQGQDIVDRIILDHYAEKPDQQEGLQAFSAFLGSIVHSNGNVLDYFTTNYDLGIESTCKEYPLPVPLVTGLQDPLVLRGTWNSALLSIRRRSRKGLYVHRLHGCVRWFRARSHGPGKTATAIVARPRVPAGQAIEACVMYPGRKLRVTLEPYADSFRRLRDTLERASFCLIIGTSFRDNSVMEYILEANDRRRRPLPIAVVDLSDIRPHFFDRIRQVRDDTYFQYSCREWKVEFIVGDYLDPAVQRRIAQLMKHPESIPQEKEDAI